MTETDQAGMGKSLRDWAWKRSLSLPLALLTLALIVLVSPVGDFPLNDDWVYGKSVQDMLRQGRLVVHPYAAALSLTHILWGHGFAYHLGFTYTTLRLSTIVLAFVGAYAVAASMRTIGQSRGMSLLCGTLVLLNPLYVNLSYTFMTDVPFVAATALSGLFFLRALRYGEVNDVLVGTFFSIVATANRQFGALVWIAYAVTLFMLWFRRGVRPNIRLLVSTIVPWVASIPILWYWTATRDTENPLMIETPPSEVYNTLVNWMDVLASILWIGLFLLPILGAYAYARLTRLDPGKILRYLLLGVFVTAYVVAIWLIVEPSGLFLRLLDRFGHMFANAWALCGYVTQGITYLGLFLLPVGLARAGVIARRIEPWSALQYAVFGAFCIVFVSANYQVLPLPSMPNMITDFAIGPKTLTDTYRIHYGWSTVSIGTVAWWIITALAMVSGGVVFNDLIFNGLVHIFDPNYLRLRQRADWLPHQEIFLLSWAVLMLMAPYNPFVVEIYDRYLLQALAPCCLLCMSHLNLSRSAGRARKITVGVTLAILSAVSVVCVQDYMAWNRARWKAVEYLHSQPGITPNVVDGGFEYNGFYTSDRAIAIGGTKGLMNGSRNWWVEDDQYAISFTERPGYIVEKTVPYFSWLGMREYSILVLKRVATPPAPGLPGD